ncbi:MAG: hypothetical protein FWG65_03360 [Turicibacter sp.]|nr:hypothetical protein [Turicibacter sp.]
MRTYRVSASDNAVSFREYIDNLENRYREDRQRHKEDMLATEQRYREDRQRYKEDMLAIEQRYKEDKLASEQRYKDDKLASEQRYKEYATDLKEYIASIERRRQEDLERHTQDKIAAEKRYTEAEQARVREYRHLRWFIVGSVTIPALIAIIINLAL